MTNQSEVVQVSETSALERIKALELEIARQIAVIKVECEQHERTAHHDAQQVIQQATDSGQSQAADHYQALMNDAHQQAQTIIENAQESTQALTQQQAQFIAQASTFALNLLLGQQDERANA